MSFPVGTQANVGQSTIFHHNPHGLTLTVTSSARRCGGRNGLMTEWVDVADSKSAAEMRPSSSLGKPTKYKIQDIVVKLEKLPVKHNIL